MNDDLISRAEAIDILDAYQVMVENGEENPYAWARLRMSELPSAQPEPTLEQIEEYCHKRCLSIVDNALLHKYAQPATNCSEIPNTSDLVSRKAVREMVATWSYDLAEWEDMELALHDVDELPHVSAELKRGKKNEGYF